MQSDINGAPEPSERLDYSVNETPYDTTAPVPTTLATTLKVRSVSQIEKVEKKNLEFLFLSHATEGGFEASLASFKAAAGRRAASSIAALSATYQFCIDLNEFDNPRERMIQLYKKKAPEATIKSNVHPVVLAVKYVFDEDPKRASWYARALRYALYMCVAPANLVEFVRDNQGIDGCASKYAQYIREAKHATTDTPKSAAKSKSIIVCSADVLETLKLYIDPDSKRGTYITVFEEEGDNIVIRSIEVE